MDGVARTHARIHRERLIGFRPLIGCVRKPKESGLLINRDNKRTARHRILSQGQTERWTSSPRVIHDGVMMMLLIRAFILDP